MALTWDAQSKRALASLGDNELKAHARVTIGGTDPTKFVPNINACKWDDECYFNINFPQVVTNQLATFTDGMVSQTIGDFTHRYYVDADGNIEYEFILGRRPPASSFTLSISYSEGLLIGYQPPLTQEEKDAGCGASRPDAEGSWVIYWSKSNNKYKTGKFCEIFRPKFTDANGNWIWGDIVIDQVAKTLTISVSPAWKNSAVYPVTVGPNIGYDTVGSLTAGSNSYQWFNWSQATETGVTGTFHCAVAAVDGTDPGVRLALYGPVGSDGDIEGHSKIEEVTYDVTVNNDCTAAAAGSSITDDSYYSLGSQQEDTDTKMYYNAISNTSWRDTKSWASGFDATGPAMDGLINQRHSAWVDYAAGGAAPSMSISETLSFAEALD